MNQGQIGAIYRRGAKFIKELQRSHEKRKKRWLVGLSAAAMALVIMLWFVYLNATVPQIAPKVSVSSQTETNSFFSIFKRGIGVIANDVKNQIAALKESFEKNFDALKKTIKNAKEYSFEGQKNIFNFSEPEAVPPTPLP